MSARSIMTQRAVIERNGNSMADGFGQPGMPVWSTHLSALPCYAWSKERMTTDREAGIAIIGELRMAVPKGADVREDDRVARVEDRLGTLIHDGPMRIRAIEVRESHKECILQDISS